MNNSIASELKRMSIIETQNIEFKQRWRDDFLAELCGFANAQGGTLYIGLDDKGMVCKAFRDSKLSSPTFENLMGGSLVVIPRGNQIEPLNEKGNNTQLNESQHKVYDFISVMAQSVEPLNEPLNTTRIAKELGMAYSTVKRVMKFLEENHLIRRVGSKKTGYWEIVANAFDSQNDTQNDTHRK